MSNNYGTEWHEITLKSGLTLEVRKVSSFWIQNLRSSLPQPQPPTEEIDDGAGGTRIVGNHQHPDHQQALRDYDRRVNEMTMRALLAYGARPINVSDEERDRTLRELSEMAAIFTGNEPEPLPKSNAERNGMYVSQVLMSTTDLDELTQYLLRLNKPSAQAVADAKKS